MPNTDLVKRSSQCSLADSDRYVANYCFNDLTEEERRAFESHLLECDVCWSRVQQLAPAINILRADQSLGEDTTASDMLSVLGISARLDWPFGGQLWHVVVSCGLLALLYSVALFVEIAYQFDRYGPLALKVAPLIFLWIMSTSLAGLAADWRQTRLGKTTGLLFSVPIFIGASLLLYAALGLFLPTYPITQANFQTYSAYGAYLKSIYYFLPLAIIFLVLPFHFIVSMQREMRAGRHRFVLALVTGKRWSVAPRGAIYLKVWALGLILAGAAIVSLALTAHLLENLKPGIYMNLFIQLVEWRFLLYFALGLECLLWYYRSVNEIKRECLGVALIAVARQ